MDWVRLIVALSQVQASCVYAPPPVLAQGQGGDTLGRMRVNAGTEVGYGVVASWWKASGVGDADINSSPAGAMRIRLGLTDDLDVGVVGGLGPDQTIVAGPEVKWRFARLVESSSEDSPAFHASIVSGVGLGTSTFRYGGYGVDAGSSHLYLAPYTGLLVSGGIPLIQMYSGLRVAGSQTLDASRADLTIYPVLAFGIEMRPEHFYHLFVEGDLAGGYTTQNAGDAAILGYAVGGVSMTFDLAPSQ